MSILHQINFRDKPHELTIRVTTEKGATILYVDFSDKFRFHGICLYKPR